MKNREIKVNSRVAWQSKTHRGNGVVTEIFGGRTGNWVSVKTKDHPAGVVTVRESQVR
jgi:hypothetical protein